MAAITGILCQIITSDIPNAGTDGRVYVGIGGREFRLDSEKDDYERNSWREYVLGRGPVEPDLPSPQIRVENPDDNDPRKGHPLHTERLLSSPVYLRFEPEGDSPNWNVDTVFVLVYQGEGSFVGYFSLPTDFDNVWLGDPYGKTLFLTESWFPEGRPRVPERIAKLLELSPRVD
jgi:hypothetical protein